MASHANCRTMEFELAPGVPVQTGTFNAVIAPEELILPALASPACLKYLFLYLAGNKSGILPVLTGRPGTIEVIRAASARQYAAAIRGSRHTVLFVEHDPSLYDSPEDVIPVAKALETAAEDAVVVLYTPESDQWFDMLLPWADQVFFFRAPPVSRKTPRAGLLRAQKRPEGQKGQTSLGGFTGEMS